MSFSMLWYTKSVGYFFKFTKSVLKEPALQKKKKKLQHMFGFLYFKVLTTLSELQI